MKYFAVMAAMLASGSSQIACAEWTSTLLLTNDYDFRGITQSAREPALQASLDYKHGSGAYASVWMSNVKLAESLPRGWERDLYLGMAGSFNDSWTYDAGAVAYTYNQTVFDCYEVYAAVAYRWLTLRLGYLPDYGGRSTPGETPGRAALLDADIPLGESDAALLLHVGRNWDEVWHTQGGAYTDYAVGMAYSHSDWETTLKYVGTNASAAKGNLVHADVLNNENRWILSISRTIHW